MARTNGTVKWFNATKGFGFITTEDQGDIFIHHSNIKADGFRTLNEGDEVEFEVEQGHKGLQAVDLVILKSAKQTANSKKG